MTLIYLDICKFQSLKFECSVCGYRSYMKFVAIRLCLCIINSSYTSITSFHYQVVFKLSTEHPKQWQISKFDNKCASAKTFTCSSSSARKLRIQKRAFILLIAFKKIFLI